jgi:hypothetical protein
MKLPGEKMKIALNLLAAVFMTTIIGCQDARPSYIEPPRVPEQTATLTGAHGCYIAEVDDQSVPSARIMFADFGSNTVHVTPGIHTLLVVNSLTISSQTTYISHWFSLRCAPGHTYQLAPESKHHYNILCIADQPPAPSTQQSAQQVNAE